MIYRLSCEQLLKEGSIKRCPLDHKAIKNLLRRAYADIKTAKRNISDDQECSYTYAYNALLRSGIALMFTKGFRPEIRNKHLTVIKFAAAILGNEFNELINDYDFMRRKRHKFIYEPGIPCSRKEAKDAIKTAEKLLAKISKLVKESFPQQEFNF